jgi:hypothetical protein
VQQSLTKGFNAIPLEAMNLGNPALGGDPNYLNALVPNPFAGLIPGTALNNADGRTIPATPSVPPVQ